MLKWVYIDLFLTTKQGIRQHRKCPPTLWLLWKKMQLQKDKFRISKSQFFLKIDPEYSEFQTKFARVIIVVKHKYLNEIINLLYSSASFLEFAFKMWKSRCSYLSAF